SGAACAGSSDGASSSPPTTPCTSGSATTVHGPSATTSNVPRTTTAISRAGGLRDVTSRPQGNGVALWTRGLTAWRSVALSAEVDDGGGDGELLQRHRLGAALLLRRPVRLLRDQRLLLQRH